MLYYFDKFLKRDTEGNTEYAGSIGEYIDSSTKGEQGIQGIEGPVGPQGDEGPVGPQGDEGPTGPQGEEGPQGDPGEIPLVKAFSVYKLSPAQVIAAETWTVIEWDALWYEYNTPQFNLAAQSHVPADAGLLGLWHYDLSIRTTVDTKTILVFRRAPDSVNIAVAEHLSGLHPNISFDWPFPITGKSVYCQIWSELANTIEYGTSNSWWNGHFVGPLA